MAQKGTKIGEILLAQGLIDEDQLQHAMNEHQRTGLMLGKVIVRLGFVDEETMASILGEQITLKQKKRLGEILLEQKIVKQEDIDEALAMQKRTGQKIGKCLLELKRVSEEKLLDVLSAQLDIPQVRLKNYHFDHSAVALITEEMARTHKVVPLYVRGKTLTIAMVDPTDMRTVDYIHFKTQMNVDSVITTESDVTKAIESLYGVQNAAIDELIGDDKAAAKSEETPDADADNMDFSSEEGRKIVAIVNSIISEAVQGGVSDIHLEPEDSYLRLRYRTDGELAVRSTIPHTLSNAILSRFKILANMDIAEKRKPQDGRITIKLSGHEVDLRVSSFPVSLRKRGVMEKIVIRILDPEKNQFSLDDMGMLPITLKRLRAGIRLPNGIILVTGPTGSGKSTTLYACIREINRPEVNISTMEDPVELNIDGINQGQINNAAGFTFAAGIRSLLRQDPDIMLIGEMRDKETSSMAVEAALTGHLVLSTLHTNDTCGAFPRLLEMGLEPYLVTSAVKGVLAQRLVRRICQVCKKEVEVDEETKRRLHVPLETKFYKGEGCAKCDGTGKKGRVPIIEYLVPDEGFCSLVLKRASGDELKHYALEHCGLVTLRADGLDKASHGICTLEDALAASTADFDD